MPKPPTVEECLSRLEESIARLEDGQLTLEQSLSTYEDGLKALRQARAQLDAFATRLQELQSETPKEEEPEGTSG